MKKKLFIFAIFTISIIAQNKEKISKALPTANLKCGSLKGEKVINQYYNVLRSYFYQKKNNKFTPEQLKKVEKKLYASFLFVPNLKYRTITEKAKIYLIESTPDNDDKDTEKKLPKLTFIKNLNSATEIQAFQLKQQEGSLLRQQIANLETDLSKTKELEDTKKRLISYHEKMYTAYGIRSNLTYQTAKTEISIYIIANYEDLKKLSEFQSLQQQK